MSFKKKVLENGLKLMQDPRVARLMADPRVMKAVLAAISVPGKVSTFTTEQVEKIAKAMALASDRDVSDLQRTVRRLEEELADLRRERDGRSGR